jgi:glycosyltransferase involved in cell wall biosynthesis
MERVSIVIPTYNQAHFIGEALDSALAQTRPADEILVVDNGSTDRTADVVRSYPAVGYIRQDNQGVCGSSNRGIREATGDYLVLLHSDDHLLPRHLEASLRAFRDRPEAAFVCGNYRWFGAEGLWHKHDCSPAPDLYATLLRYNFIGPPLVVMFRREVLLRLGGFRAEFEGADDQEIYLRIARAYPIHCHHEVIAEYRRHESQGSRKCAVMLKASIAVLQAQRRHFHGNRQYREAYQAGIRFRQNLYGDQLFWQGLQAAKTRSWAQASLCFSTLARYHPRGLINPVLRRLSDAWSNIAHVGAS